MKHKTVGMGLLFSHFILHTAFSANGILFGAWELEKFKVISPSGTQKDFCKGATGKIIYESSGYMSVSINCAAKTKTPEPADDYQRIFFYTGSYELNAMGDAVTHHITNSSSLNLVGKDSIRKVEKLDDKSLILSGAFGTHGDTLLIEWSKLPTFPHAAAKAPSPKEPTFAMLTLLKVKPNEVENFKKEVTKIVKASHSETDNIAWYVQQSQNDATDFVFYTRWKNATALDTHLNSPPLKKYLEKTAPMLEPGHLQLVRYWPVDILP